MTIVLFVVYASILGSCFYLLAKVCDNYFVSSLDKIAKKLNMSHDIAGATLMAMGSSAPELFVSLFAVIKPGGFGNLGAGTIIGSAIFNILVIVGASAIVARKATLLWQPVIRDISFYITSILVLLFTFSDGVVTLTEIFVFLAIYVLYIIIAIYWEKIVPNLTEEETTFYSSEETTFEKTGFIDGLLEKIFPNKKKYYSVFTISIIVIALLSWILVESAVKVSEILHVPSVIIALTVLAAGTSIPDLISSMIVAKQGRSGMAISNAVGSNIFDILFGLGFPWLIYYAINKQNIVVSTENLYSSIVLLFATVAVIILLLVARKWKVCHKFGWFLIILYVAYLVYSIVIATNQAL